MFVLPCQVVYNCSTISVKISLTVHDTYMIQPCSSSVFNHHIRPKKGSSEPNEPLPPGSAAAVDFIAKEFFSAHQLSLDKSLTLQRTAVAESSLAASRPPTAVDSLCSEIRERDPFKIAFSETDGVLRSAHCRQLYNQ